METTNDLLERLRASNDGCSDYRLAKLMGTTQAHIIRWTKHGKTMDDSYAIKIAELLDIDPAYVLICMHAERSASVEATKVWERIAGQFVACFAVMLFANLLFSGSF